MLMHPGCGNFSDTQANKKSQSTLACELMHSGLETFFRRNVETKLVRPVDTLTNFRLCQSRKTKLVRFLDTQAKFWHYHSVQQISLGQGRKKVSLVRPLFNRGRKKIWQIKKQSPIARGERALLFFTTLKRTTCLTDKTNHPVKGLSLNRSQYGSCSTKYDTPAGT